MRIQIKKVFEDLLDNYQKTVLVIIAIALGVFSMGVILDTYAVTDREMLKSYMSTNPADIVLSVEQTDDALLELLENETEIRAMQLRVRSIACSGVEAPKYETMLYVIPKDTKSTIQTFYGVEGKEYPGEGEILLEKTSFSVVGASIGDSLALQLAGESPKNYTIVGSVQADGTNPAWMHEQVIGYLSEKGARELGENGWMTEILIKVNKTCENREEMIQIANLIQDNLASKGYSVNYSIVATPGEHPNAAQMNAVLLLFRIFGSLSLLLSAVLVYCMISSLLQEQIRQIAIMKSLGATVKQLCGMYYLYVAVLGIMAALIAIPCAALLSGSMCEFTSSILVFTIRDHRIPVGFLLLQLVIAVILPMLSATLPILKACMEPTVKGLYGTRNTIKKKSRIVFSILTLGLSGAIFLSSVSVRVSLQNSFAAMRAGYQMDAQFFLMGDYEEQSIEKLVMGVNGVSTVVALNDTYANLLDQFEGDHSNLVTNQSMELMKLSVTYEPGREAEDITQDIADVFEENQVAVVKKITMDQAELIFQKHLYSVASFLIGASVLVILVGVISLISIAGMNVTDRKREIGILRSIGTNGLQLFLRICSENALRGFLGVILSWVASIPLAYWIGGEFGRIFLEKPLPYAFSPEGIVIWLLSSLGITILVSIIGTSKMMKCKVCELLSQ